MQKAQVNGQTITVEDFLARYGVDHAKQDIYPRCPICTERLFISSAFSTNRQTSFSHYKNSQCPLIVKKTKRGEVGFPFGIKDIEFDISQSHKLKQQVINDDNTLKQLYAKCWKLSGKGCLSAEQFCEIVRLSVKSHIWAYENMTLAQLPYILVLLTDFPVEVGTQSACFDAKDNKKALPPPSHCYFRYVLRRHSKQKQSLKSFLNNRHDYYLQKTFLSGKAYRSDKSPYAQISIGDSLIETVDTNWIEAKHIAKLIKTREVLK